VSKAVKVILVAQALAFLLLVWFAVRGSWLMARWDHEAQGAAHISGELIIFHAGSLAVPFKKLCKEFNNHYPKVRIIREAAGSRECARKITDLDKPCDVMASADYTVINTLLIPEYAEWNIKFASNEMVIAFREDSRGASRINRDNWSEILLEKDVVFSRSDPNADPCGYRAILVIKLAEKFYNKPGITGKMLTKDRRYIRPKEVDLLALLEAGELDYIFIYRSIAEQHKLRYVVLPDKINLKKADLAHYYKSASVHLTGKKPGTFVTKVGEPIVYGVTIPRNAPNRELALVFLRFLLDANKGGAILVKNGQTLVVPSLTETFDELPECLKVFALPTRLEAERKEFPVASMEQGRKR
jgi:molybdate/tungstate transport system substrate-binding protein